MLRSARTLGQDLTLTLDLSPLCAQVCLSFRESLRRTLKSLLTLIKLAFTIAEYKRGNTHLSLLLKLELRGAQRLDRSREALLSLGASLPILKLEFSVTESLLTLLERPPLTLDLCALPS